MNIQEAYQKFQQQGDQLVARLLRNQITDRQSSRWGGIWDTSAGWASQISGIVALEPLICAYLTPASRYYQNEQVLAAIDAAFAFCGVMQRPDGTFDLSDCNFYSAPDTAFSIQSLWRAYQIAEQSSAEGAAQLGHRLADLIESCAQGVAAGGFHTPNHRWVITSALLASWKLTGRPEFFQRSQDYLAEGIDCSEDGEFTERSAAIYNIVNDYALLLIAELTGEDRYLSYIQRNLDMMMTFYEPDGSVFTMNSTRQDNNQKLFPVRYWYLYQAMSQRMNRPDYAAFATWILQTLLEEGQDCAELLPFSLLHPDWAALPGVAPHCPDQFSAFYPHSGIVRIRRGDFTASFLRDNPTFFAAQLGEIGVYLRAGISFFNVRNLIAQTLEEINGGYRMIFSTEGTYRLPFGAYQGSPLWADMDHSKRGVQTPASLTVTLELIPCSNGVDLTIDTQGCDLVPIKLELGVPAGVQVINSHFQCTASGGSQLLVREGEILLDNGTHCLQIGPAFADHAYIKSRSGIVEPSRENMNLYFTGTTNFHRTISFRAAAPQAAQAGYRGL